MLHSQIKSAILDLDVLSTIIPRWSSSGSYSSSPSPFFYPVALVACHLQLIGLIVLKPTSKSRCAIRVLLRRSSQIDKAGHSACSFALLNRTSVPCYAYVLEKAREGAIPCQTVTRFISRSCHDRFSAIGDTRSVLLCSVALSLSLNSVRLHFATQSETRLICARFTVSSFH